MQDKEVQNLKKEQESRFDIALDQLHETTRVSATRCEGTSIDAPLKIIEAIREYHKQVVEHNAATNKEPIMAVVRYHTNTKTTSATEMRQMLLDDYIEKVMAHIHYAFDERTTSIIVVQRDADMVSRIDSIMTELGYRVLYTKETSTINVSW